MSVRVTWLGQSGFVFEAGDGRILVDPFFDAEFPGRAYPPPDIDRHGRGCNWLLVTHEHADHLDVAALPRLAAISDALTVVAPEPLAALVDEAAPGVAFRGVRPGDRVALGGAGHATVVPAVHALHPADGYSDGARTGGAPRFVGYVLDLGGVRLYHAGDTIAADAVLAGLEGIRVDVALLPVNGRDYFREQADLAGNLDVREAVALAQHVGASIIVPCHWDLFEANGERPGAVVDAAAAADAPLHVLTLRRELPWVAEPSG